MSPHLYKERKGGPAPANGDFARWASNAKDAVKAAGREIESDACSSTTEMIQDVKEAATEVVHNPGEAIKEAATAIGEAAESGEIPPP
jgi:hypothetical protein